MLGSRPSPQKKSFQKLRAKGRITPVIPISPDIAATSVIPISPDIGITPISPVTPDIAVAPVIRARPP